MAKPAHSNLQDLDINLIPSTEGQGNIAIIVRWLLSVGRFLIIGTEIIALIIFGLSIKFTVDKNNLKEEIEQKKAVIDTLASYEDRFRLYQTKLENIQTLKSSHSNLAIFYDDLLKLLPGDALLDNIQVDMSHLVISGSLPNPGSLQALISSLNNSQKFSDLDITNLTVPTSAQPFYQFTANATFRPGVVSIGDPSFNEAPK